METVHEPPDAGVHHPGIHYKDQYSIYNVQLEATQSPGIYALSPQYP